MTNKFDQKLQHKALETIKRLCDEPIIYRRVHKGTTYNPATGKTEAPPPDEFSVYALIQAYGEHSYVNGTVIEVGDMKASIPVLQLDFEPSIGDQLLFDGKTWLVKGRGQTRGTSAPIIWELQVRCG